MHQKPDLSELLLLKIFNNNEQYVGKYKNYSSFVCKLIIYYVIHSPKKFKNLNSYNKKESIVC